MYVMMTCNVRVQVHKRAAAAAGAVRDGHVVHPVRGLRGAARLHGAAPLLRGALGPRGVAAARAHVLQPPRPAALPRARAALRQAAARRRGDQHLRHRVNGPTPADRARATLQAAARHRGDRHFSALSERSSTASPSTSSDGCPRLRAGRRRPVDDICGCKYL